MERDFQSEFIENSCYRMGESLRMIELALRKINHEELWKRPNKNSNCIGNLILHLCGNITQYAIASLSDIEDKRDRDAEFAVESGLSKEQLMAQLKNTIELAENSISALSEEELLRVREVQGYSFSGIGIIVHVVEHLSYHTGQIAFWVKLLKDDQLGFYDGVDLNQLNKIK